MAATASTIDLRTQTSYALRLGTSILRAEESKRWRSVRYNHKPRLHATKDASYIIKPTELPGQEELVLRDGKEEYEFSGRSVSNGADYYVLVGKGIGNGREVVLEKLEACHEFNLVKTPSEPDAARLAAKFPQLSVNGDEEDGLFGAEDGAVEPVDPSNPWDYRNYLKANIEKSTERNAVSKASNSTANTPQLQPGSTKSSTPLSRPTKQSASPLISQQKKRKAPDNNSKAAPNPKRVKAGTSAEVEKPIPASTSSTNKPPKIFRPDIPRVQVERKATIRRTSLPDDSGELILENETPTSQKPGLKQQSSMALALSGQLGPGPISLHSAASSPASMIASPAPERPEGMMEEYEFEFEDGSPEVPPRTSRKDDVSDEDADVDADADVEDFELPSPAQTHRKSVVSAATVTGVAADDDDDLDKQLALAMAEEEDEGGSVSAQPASRAVAESDEESEEE